MKKGTFYKCFLLLIALLSFEYKGQANTHYWVDGTGTWNDANHWSLVSGGQGGAGVPGMNDDVIFDKNSFHVPGEIVTIPAVAACHNMEWSSDVYSPVLYGNPSAYIEIYGNLILAPDLDWQFDGTVYFKSSRQGNIITTYGRILPCNMYFDGSGSWLLNGPLVLSSSSNLTLASGDLHANGNMMQCSTLIVKGNGNKLLDINKSILVVKNQIDSTSASNFTSSSIKGQIYYKNYSGVADFAKLQNPRYPRVQTITGVDTTVTRPSCNCTDTAGSLGAGKCCNGKVVITKVIANDNGPFGYTWSTGSTVDSATGICASLGFVTCTIFDSADFSTFLLTVPVNIPPIKINQESTKPPKCNGQCNGWIIVNSGISGGTPNYNYVWSAGVPGSGTVPENVSFVDSGLCVSGVSSTYNIVITDAHKCRTKNFYSIGQPTAVTVTATSTNILCFGFCDGTAKVTSTSGGHNPPPTYTYKWSPGGQTTTSISALCPGTYTVTAFDDSLCSGTASVTITQPNPLVLNPSQTNVTCNGFCNGTASVSPTGGTSPYTYKWSPGLTSTTPSVSGLCASPPTYKVVVTDANGCKDSATFVITQPVTLKANLTFTNIDCNGNCNGTAKVVPTGGTTPYTYKWSTGATTTNVSGLCASPPTYWVKVTDANNCVDSVSFVITQPPPLVANPVAHNLKCTAPPCNGSAAVHPTGGTPPYTYLWYPSGNTTDSISGLCQGTYTIVITDKNKCKDSLSITITQPPPIVINITSANINCNGNCNGSATANVSGGTPAYTYNWSNGKTTSAISPLCPGTYTITVTDKNGCTATSAVTITQPNPLKVTLSAVPNPLNCFGDANATISTTVTGGTAPYNYVWTPGGQVTPTITGQSAGTYKVVVTDANGCKDSASITITQPPQLRDSIIAIKTVNEKCNGDAIGSATVGVKGGTPPYLYNWAPSGGSGATASNLTAGTYTVTVTDKNGCTATASVVITQPPPLVLIMGNKSEKCNGNSNGEAYVTASGGTPPYTYAWTPVGGTLDTAKNLSIGCYTVTVKDAHGCSATASTCITEPPLLAANITSTTSSCNICDGSAKVTATGGTPPYTYQWTTIPVQTTDSATGLCIGTYTVTVTDANGCTATAKATIVATVKITVTTNGSNVSCFNECDGIATANPSGGLAPYTYTWAPGGQNTQTVTGLCPGSYTVTVKDANGCTTIDSIKIGNPPKLTVLTSQTNVTCIGKCNGSATANPSGGTGAYTYLWKPGGQTTATINNLCVGNDTIIVTDANGCTVSAVVTITSNGSMNDNPTITPPTCGNSDGKIVLNPTGGTAPYNYVWTPPVSTSNTATGLSAGTYTVNITDNAGCTQTFLIVLNNITGPTLSATNTGTTCSDTCDGSASVTVTAGVAPFSYLWSNGKTTTSITALCPGVYVCTVTDANGCKTGITDTIKKPIPISPNPSVQNIICNTGNPTGKITLSPTGGTGPYLYSWAPGGQTTSSVSALSAGTYTITIKDNVGCDTVINVKITEPPVLSVNITSANISCNGANDGSATANPSGGTPAYIYSWSNGAVTPTDVNLSQGTYTVTVTDANGCTATASVVITQPAPLSDVMKPLDVPCNLGANGGAVSTPSGGTPPYTYLWSNGQTKDSLQNVAVGTYYLTITDAHGCTYNDSVKITQPPPIVITFTSINESCNGDCNGSATANVSGGTPPYGYSWSPSGGTGKTATALCAGTYTVTITDKNGCTANNNVTITAPPKLNANPSATSTSCPRACNGTATASPTGGTGAYTYKWLPSGQTNATATNLCAGADTVIVTDKNGCVDTGFITVPKPTPLSISVTTAASNCNVSNGSITITPSGGTGPYAYVWTPPVSTSNSATGLSAGTYTVQITDSKGCDSIFGILLNNTGGASSFTNTKFNEPCFGDDTGYIDVVPSGGTLPYTYFWTNVPSPNGQNTDSIYTLTAGTYTLQVTDNAGCIQFDTVTITQPPALADRGTITNANCAGVCTGTISLNTSGGTSPYNYLWSNGKTTANITGLCPGNYTVTITDANGCDLQQIFTVGANTVITVTTVPTNILCNGALTGSAKANASGGGGIYAYSWSPGLQTSQTAINLSAGTYTVTVTDQNGCQGTATATIAEPPPININLKVTPITCNNACDGKIVANVSGGTPPYTYSWTPVASTIDSVTNLCNGKFVVTVKDANGCLDKDSATLINPPVFNETHIVNNATCNTDSNGSITLTVTGGITPYTYTWSPPVSTSANATKLSIGTYTVTIKDSTGCAITDFITVPSDTTVLAEAGKDTGLCIGAAAFVTLNGSKSINASSYQWVQLPGMIPLGNTAIITIPIPASTTSYMLITKDGTCVDNDTVTVTINPPPIVDAGPTKTIFIYSSTTIGGSPTGPAGSTYRWRPPTGLNDSTIANPTASPTVTTTYTVIVTNSSGCTGSDTVTVIVLPQIVIPDGFTPNGDGQNDVWNIKNIYEFPNAVVEVFNRWGEQLFYSTGYKTPWNGTYNNEPLPVGTYYYIIDLHDPRFPKAYTGPVTIMR